MKVTSYDRSIGLFDGDWKDSMHIHIEDGTKRYTYRAVTSEGVTTTRLFRDSGLYCTQDINYEGRTGRRIWRAIETFKKERGL